MNDHDLQHELDDIARRTRRYWFEDGLAELFGGATFLLLGLLFLTQPAIDRLAPGVLAKIGFPLIFVALVFASRGLVRAAKARLVYPRTGYVAYEQRGGHRVATAVLAFVISALLALLATRAPLVQNWIPAFEGLVFGTAFLLLGRKVGMMRFRVEGLLCALIGLTLSLLGLDEDFASGLLFAGVGIVVLAGGGAALVAYLRRAPRRADA